MPNDRTITDLVANIFMDLLDQSLIGVEGKYTLEDLHRVYPELTNPEVTSLDYLIQQQFDPNEKDPNQVLDVHPARIHEYMESFLFDCHDGWSNQEVLVIMQLFRDIQHAWDMEDPKIPPHVHVKEYNNLDAGATKLWLVSGDTTEVNPTWLFINMLENMGSDGETMLKTVHEWERSLNKS